MQSFRHRRTAVHDILTVITAACLMLLMTFAVGMAGTASPAGASPYGSAAQIRSHGTETEHPHETETQHPHGTETEHPGETETQHPHETETEHPHGTETQHPHETETAQPHETETVRPGETETARPGTATVQPTVQPGDLEPSVPGIGSRNFPETGKSVTGMFLQYWNSRGSLQQQGFPISGVMRETSGLNGKPYTVQYFERAVFELHPENKAPFDVLLSQLGTFQWQQKYGK